MAQVVNIRAKQRDAQNRLIRDRLAAADACVAGLIRQQLTVLSVHIEHRQPVIIIQNPRGKLAGVTFRRSSSQGGFQEAQAVPMLGCQVQWTIET